MRARTSISTLLAVVLITAVIVAGVNLGVDCLYALIDPRIRFR